MDTEKALLQAIEDNPGDDASWLVLSDWLEEQGSQDRAELMRLQLRLRRDLDFPERPAWEKRLQRLLAEGVRPCLPRRSVVLSPAVSLELVLIPPGSFWMGSPATEKGRLANEGPVHRVTLTKGFWMGVYPVTQIQWWVVRGTQPSRFKGNDRPVERVSWTDAQEFCARLGKSFRLPTEAEWEYACRAGTSTRYSAGKGIGPLARVGWCNNGGPTTGTKVVGGLQPNAYGLFDMHGNVFEWCQDRCRGYTAEDVVDPREPEYITHCATRGGSWRYRPNSCRSAYRRAHRAEDHNDALGCRVVMETRRA